MPYIPLGKPVSMKHTRACPFAGCGQAVHPTKFCCTHHWRQLSQAEKAEIWDAYHDYLTGVVGLAGLRERQHAIVNQWEARGGDCSRI